MASEIAATQQVPTNLKRYLQLTVLMFAAGSIYPLLYLRQNFEVSMLESFGISISELGRCYSILGILFFLTYLPSGWLADRFTPRSLLTVSLAATGFLGIWYWTLPGFTELQIIFGAWGISTGLTFWGALIKETNLLAGHDEQGRFFGILEGGRGLVEAILATVAVSLFAWSMSSGDTGTTESMRLVILMYVVILLIMAPIVHMSLAEIEHDGGEDIGESKHMDGLRDALAIFRKQEVWLASICILAGYTLFYATYSFAGYLQTELSLSAVAVGWVTLGRLWMRPIGGIAAGFIGDRFQVDRVLGIMLLGSSVGLAGMIFLPAGAGITVILFVVLTVGLLTFAVRGLYWGTLESCNVSNETKGLAIGVISLIGYSPEIYVPLVNGYLVEQYPGRFGYGLFYGSVALIGLVGGAAAFRLMRISAEHR